MTPIDDNGIAFVEDFRRLKEVKHMKKASRDI